MTKDTGGSAFPLPSSENTYAEYGMTLRDWFAGQALAMSIQLHDAGNFDGGNEAIAACAYQVADAMLAERAKR